MIGLLDKYLKLLKTLELITTHLCYSLQIMGRVTPPLSPPPFPFSPFFNVIWSALKLVSFCASIIFFLPFSFRPDLEQQEYGGSAGPFRCGKVSTWEGGFRVPAIAWYPGKIANGRTTKVTDNIFTVLVMHASECIMIHFLFQLAAGYDILPTLFNLAGATIPSDRRMDGYDLAPILFNKQDVRAVERSERERDYKSIMPSFMKCRLKGQ